MKKNTILKIINIVLFVAVFLQFAGIITLQFYYAEWIMDIHKLNGYFIGLLIVLHITYNWSWVKSNFFKTSNKK